MTTTALIVRIPVEILDPTWTMEDLQSNAVIYIQAILDQAERRNQRDFGPPAYRLDVDDTTVWTEENFALDLADLAREVKP